MRYMAFLLIFASGCGLIQQPPSPPIESVHPDWPKEVTDLCKIGRFNRGGDGGFTKDQFECSLAYWCGGNVRGDHWHKSPRSSSVSSDGISVYIYYAPYGTTISAGFLNGKLQSWSQSQF